MADKDKEKKDKDRLELLETVALLAKPEGCPNITCKSCEVCQIRQAALIAALKKLEETK